MADYDSMRRVFVQYSCFYPAYKAGGPIQSLMYLLEKLNGTVEIFLLTSSFDLDGTRLNVAADCWLKTKFGNVFYSSEITCKQIKQLIAEVKPDVFYLNSFFSSLTIKVLYLLRKDSRKIVIAPRGEFSPNALLLKKGKKSIYIYVFKHLLFANKIWWHFTNNSELQDYKKRLTIKNMQYQIVPNLHSVNLNNDYFKYSDKEQGAIKIVSVGRVSPMKNMAFLIEILSKIEGYVICDIYGAIEDIEYYSLCKCKLNSLPGNIKITFKGEIETTEVVDTISKYDLFFSPSLGENFGHAVFESLIAGLPILISDKIPFFSEVELYEAGFISEIIDPESFINRINELVLCDNKQFLSLKKNVCKYIKYLDGRINNISIYIELLK